MKIDEKQRLFLVGYMGAGKTTTGRILAKKLNWSFIDVDTFIENRYRRTITAIFEEKGEAGFREIEREVLREICNFENVVISTGGGLPCFFDNMDLMNQNGITIYLKAEIDDLIHRLSFDKQKRPLIKGKSLEELRDFVEINLKKREPFYNQAQIVINTQHFSTKEDLNRWVEEYNNFSQSLEKTIK